MGKRLLSFHPKLAAAIDVLAALAFLSLLPVLNSWWLLSVWFLARLVWWGWLASAMYVPSFVSRVKLFISLAIFHLGTVWFLIFTVYPWWYLFAGVAAVFPAVALVLVPSRDDALSALGKPVRRALLFLQATGLMGLASGFSALTLFQALSGWSTLFGGAFLLFSTLMISIFLWREYGLAPAPHLPVAIGVLGLIVTELIYSAILVPPLGYLVSGFVFVWLWYVVWLMLRFALSPEGIEVPRQSWFLAVNASLLILFLIFVVRWH